MLLRELAEEFRNNRVIVVVGSGVSVAATDNAPTASWLGLIRSGIDYVEENVPGLPETWAEGARGDLQRGADHMPSLLSAATKVSTELSAHAQAAYKRWMRRDVGELKVTSPTLVESIVGLACPILTTNYDQILEEVSGRQSAVWKRPDQMQAVIQGRSNSIGHLHGIWSETDSIVLGIETYAAITADNAAMGLEQALAVAKSLVFIGCGSGLSDPNFGSLRRWLKNTFPSTENLHYRLCTKAEVAQLNTEHRDEPIVPVPYGDSHDELDGFLRSFWPAPAAAVQTIDASDPSRATEVIEEDVRRTSILAEHLGSVDGLDMSQLLIPPVLLPVTHEQFVASQDLEDGVRIQRCDLKSDLSEQRLLLAGDDGAGLTSSLEWLVDQRSRLYPDEVPIVIDFHNDLKAGPSPLRRAVEKKLLLAGIKSGRGAEFPPIALAVDNVAIYPQRKLTRLISDLAKEEFSWAAIGCKIGAEIVVGDQLREAGVPATSRYLGRLNTRDVQKMASLVAPGRANFLARKAIEIVNHLSLSRTPFVFSMVISTLLHGESLASVTSETALLDTYVNLLLGRGEVSDDSRFILDHRDRSDMLGTLAAEFVRQDKGSLAEHDVVRVFHEYFEEVDWQENPSSVLQGFKDCYLLSERAGQVVFRQASYLHLFSAKHAMFSRDFLDKLYERPLYYAPIISHYAALMRSDARTVEIAAETLFGASDRPRNGSGLFVEVEKPPTHQSVDSLIAQLDLSAHSEDEDDEFASSSDESVDWLDRFDEPEQLPFPLDRIEDAPDVVRIDAALRLVSNVLRDSDLIRNPELKKRVLHEVLLVWGVQVQIYEQDEAYQEVLGKMGRMLAEQRRVPKNRADAFVEMFLELSPILLAFSGMLTSLSSRKLLKSLDRCFDDVVFVNEPFAAVMGALFAFGLQEPGWTKYLVRTLERHPKVPAVDDVLHTLALFAYYQHRLHKEDAERLHSILVDFNVTRLGKLPHAELARRKEQISSKLRANRGLSRSRLPQGQTVFSASPDEPPVELEG
ncbi:SIR2 family protein [Kribbella lupini]|uniref:SIR2-like protein n=1 Tax=Kribbella lupini TaxID=291602 RepID=A0ABN2B1H6_9ACTN